MRGKFPEKGGPNEKLFRADDYGNVTHYQFYDDLGYPIKRVDLTGATHAGIPTPHVQEFVRNVDHSGRVFINRGKVRAARPDEIP